MIVIEISIDTDRVNMIEYALEHYDNEYIVKCIEENSNDADIIILGKITKVKLILTGYFML